MKIEDDIFEHKKNSYYIERKDAEKLFYDELEHVSDFVANSDSEAFVDVINYFGIGGIGKTTLLNHLEADLLSNKDVLFARHDFAAITDMQQTLSAIAKQLNSRYGFSFPLFDAARLAFSRKVGGSFERKETKSLLEKCPTVSLIYSNVENVVPLEQVPIVKTAMWVFELVDSAVAIVKNNHDEYRKEFAQIDYMSDDDIVKSLPGYFSFDLRKNLQKTKKPLVIMLDTYENLLSGSAMTIDGLPAEGDAWLRLGPSPIRKVPGVLWVIAGRDELDWQKSNSDWKDSLHTLCFEDFSESETSRYLKENGMNDINLRRELASFTGGTPDLLRRCAEHFSDINKDGKTISIDDFEICKRKQSERYTKGLNSVQLEVMFTMAEIGIFTRDLMSKIGSSISNTFSDVEFDTLIDDSFITTTDDLYIMNRTVRDALRAQCPKAIHERAIKELFNYYRSIVKRKKDSTPDFYLIEYARMAFELSDDKNIDKELDNVFDCACRALVDQNYDLFFNLYQIIAKHKKLFAGYRMSILDGARSYLYGDLINARNCFEDVFDSDCDKKYKNIAVDYLAKIYEIEPHYEYFSKILAYIKNQPNSFSYRVKFALDFGHPINDDEELLNLCIAVLDSDESSLSDCCDAMKFIKEFSTDKATFYNNKLLERAKKPKNSSVYDVANAYFICGVNCAMVFNYSDNGIYDLFALNLTIDAKSGYMGDLRYKIIHDLGLLGTKHRNTDSVRNLYLEHEAKLADFDYYGNVVTVCAFIKILPELFEKYKEAILDYCSNPATSTREVYGVLLALSGVNFDFEQEICSLFCSRIEDLAEADMKIAFDFYVGKAGKYKKQSWIDRKITEFFEFLDDKINDKTTKIYFLGRYITYLEADGSKKLPSVEVSYAKLVKDVFGKNSFEFAYVMKDLFFCLDENNDDRASKCLDICLKIAEENYPDWILYYHALATKYTISNQIDELRQLYIKHKDDIRYFFCISSQLINMFTWNSVKLEPSDIELAHSIVEQSEKLFGKNSWMHVRSLFFYAKILYKLGNVDKSREAYLSHIDALTEWAYSSDANTAFEWGYSHFPELRADLANKAIDLAGSCSDSSTFVSRAYQNLASAQYDNEQYDDCIETVQKWIDLYANSEMDTPRNRIIFYELLCRAASKVNKVVPWMPDKLKEFALSTNLPKESLDGIYTIFHDEIFTYKKGADLYKELIEKYSDNSELSDLCKKYEKELRAKSSDYWDILQKAYEYSFNCSFDYAEEFISDIRDNVERNYKEKRGDDYMFNYSLLKLVDANIARRNDLNKLRNRVKFSNTLSKALRIVINCDKKDKRTKYLLDLGLRTHESVLGKEATDRQRALFKALLN